MRKGIVQLVTIALLALPVTCLGKSLVGGFLHGPNGSAGGSFTLRGNIQLPTNILEGASAIGPIVQGSVLFEYSSHGTNVTIVVPEKEASKRGVFKTVVDSTTYALSRTDYETLIAESSKVFIGLPDANGKFTSQLCKKEDGLIAVIAGVSEYRSLGDITIAKVTIKFIKNDSILMLYSDSEAEAI